MCVCVCVCVCIGEITCLQKGLQTLFQNYLLETIKQFKSDVIVTSETLMRIDVAQGRMCY